MVFPFITLDDGTEFARSETMFDGRVCIDVEQPDAELCFKTATCWLPGFTWENVSGFTLEEVGELQKILESKVQMIVAAP